MKRVFRLIRALLRELSDENAYERHLAAHGRSHSGEEIVYRSRNFAGPVILTTVEWASARLCGETGERD